MRTQLVLSCEHASADVPEGVSLGVADDALRSHHVWDAGAADLARALAEALEAPLILGRVSRLVVDLNRTEESPEVVPSESFGLAVPGNTDLSVAERERRLETYHRPYRRAAWQAVHTAVGSERRCLHLSVHSFVPVLRGRRRDLDVGVLFDPERSWEVVVADAFRVGLRERGWDARPNEPYLGTDDGLTTWLRRRFPASHYAGVEVEASQRLLEQPGRLEQLGRDLVGVIGDLDQG